MENCSFIRYLLIIFDAELVLGPLASRNLALEQDIDLAVRATLELRQEEVCSNQANCTGPAPDITTFSTEVSTSRVEHVGSKENTGDLHDVVNTTTESSSERSETDSRRLSDNGIRNGSGAQGEQNRDDEAERCLC